MQNVEVRAILARNNIKMTELATAMSIRPDTLSHYFMHELTDKQLIRVEKGIELIKGERDGKRTTENQ